MFDSLAMYPGGDSNSHVLRHTHLKRTCIPFQHLDILFDNNRNKHLSEFIVIIKNLVITISNKNDNYFCI